MYILKCGNFDGEITARYTNRCCSDCHDEQKELYMVRPRKLEYPGDPNDDYSLGIEAMVCCTRLHFVRSLSREWWIRKVAEVNGWDEQKVQSLLHSGSWHKSFERRTSTYQKGASRGRYSSSPDHPSLPKIETGVADLALVSTTCLGCGSPTANGELLCPKCKG